MVLHDKKKKRRTKLIMDVKEENSNSDIFGLVLAGGSGTRLWPLSRKELPKQFLVLEGEYSLLQNTLLRLKGILPPENIRVIANHEWNALITYQAGQIGCTGDLLINEPVARNTAPAIALGIVNLIEHGATDNDIAIVCPSDHIIKDMDAFKEAVAIAVKEAATGRIVIFGIKPTMPETGFGYIRTEKTSKTSEAVKVIEFVEKPSRATAEQYLSEGCYYWNGGIFCFRLKDMMDAIIKHFPECGMLMLAGINRLTHNFSEIPSKSIDYAVMERANDLSCVPLDAQWSDVGSWDSVWENLDKDTNDNAVRGDIIVDGAKNSLIFSKNKLTAAIDINNIIVVDTPDALFVANKGSSQKVRDLVDRLKEQERTEEYQAPENVRPWGTYKIISESKTDKIKRIQVLPHKRLSLQYHEHRSEHWVVVSGMAKVTLIDQINREKVNLLSLTLGESCFVPKEMLHRLENSSNELLEIIEIQTGDYVGEDDIIRVLDDYERIS